MRVASFFWLQSMVREVHARSLIFDLDTAIQALVERLGRDDPETVRLTGIYQNLIRYWAEYEYVTFSSDICCDLRAGDDDAYVAVISATEGGARAAAGPRADATAGDPAASRASAVGNRSCSCSA
jgi:hypothetical protein